MEALLIRKKKIESLRKQYAAKRIECSRQQQLNSELCSQLVKLAGKNPKTGIETQGLQSCPSQLHNFLRPVPVGCLP